MSDSIVFLIVDSVNCCLRRPSTNNITNSEWPRINIYRTSCKLILKFNNTRSVCSDIKCSTRATTICRSLCNGWPICSVVCSHRSSFHTGNYTWVYSGNNQSCPCAVTERIQSNDIILRISRTTACNRNIKLVNSINVGKESSCEVFHSPVIKAFIIEDSFSAEFSEIRSLQTVLNIFCLNRVPSSIVWRYKQNTHWRIFCLDAFCCA